MGGSVGADATLGDQGAPKEERGAVRAALSVAQADSIQARVRADDSAVYAFRRSSTSFTYIVAAPTAARAEALVRQLAAAPSLFEGFPPAQP